MVSDAARQPGPALRPYVTWLHAYDVSGFPAGEHVGMPSSGITLVIPLGASLELSMPGTARRAMASCLAGLHDGPVTIHHQGTQRGVQLALTPLGLQRLLGVPAGAVAHQAVELADVLGGRAAGALLDRLAGEAGWPARLALVERELLRRLDSSADRARAHRPEVVRAWSMLSASGGTARVGDLAAEVGWSPRHLTDQFVAAVGTAPKVVGRIVRFERSVRLVGAGAALAEVAARCRYADQAHMTREWTRLAGTTPARWPRQDVLANVQDGRRRPAHAR